MDVGEVPWEIHLAWLKKSLQSDNRLVLIAELEGHPVATVRFDLLTQPSGWELSWTVAPEARGRGIGTRVVQYAFRISPGTPIWARVKSHNRASVAIAKKAGMSLSHADDEALWFVIAVNSQAHSYWDT